MATNDQQELSQEARDRITRSVRSLAEDRVERGLDVHRQFRCDNCGEMKEGAGASVYGAYKLCNDCLLDFSLRLAENKVGTIDDYMRRESDGTPPDFSPARDRPSVPGTIPARGVLSSNEPC